ncbi:glucosyltransferase [Tulasnella sp. 403]|nr:glucosyltransferase [Tulasnella sp. 403]
MALPMKTLRYVVFAALNVVVAREVDIIVTEPYMDEPFHVPQAQAYCRGEWSTWDPKITTPPGLYFVSLFLMKAFLLPCTLPILRLTNVLLLAVLPPLLDRVIAQVRVDDRARPWLEPSTEALIVSSFPVLWFFGFLYYTDVASLVGVVLTLWAAWAGKHKLAAVLGLGSCLFRQTNIIWLLYCLGASALHALHYPPVRREIEENAKLPPGKRNHQPTYYLFDHDPLAEKSEFLDFLIASLTVISERATVLPILPPYVVSCVLFVCFVIWNGGIVLGDKSNHVAAMHIPQLYYFVSFAAIMGWPILVSGKSGIRGLAREVAARMFKRRWERWRTAIILLIMTWTIHRYTIHHPFLLSDNRHYTFYIWRRIFMFHPLVPYLLAPGYLALCWAWFLRIGEANTLLPALLLPILCVPALLPAPLLEPRYFIIPYVLLRILAAKQPAPKWALLAEAVWYGALNWLTMWIFLYKSRQGVDGIIRFMW